MRVALAGLGSAACRGHLPALERLQSEGALTLAGAADPSAPRRQALARRLTAPTFESAELLLDSVPCDLLVVAAEPGAHGELVSLGLDRGLHVVCEKPLVIDPPGYLRVAGAYARRPELGLVAVHQYRYSPAWSAIARWARIAARLRMPFSLAVEVTRQGVDPLAASPWRADVSRSGGVLADHAVHFLALAWAIEQQLEVLAGCRETSPEGERAGASVRVGTGMLTIQVSSGRATRATRVALHTANTGLLWRGSAMDFVCGGRRVWRRPVTSLADRNHVDSLYACLYRDLVHNLARPAWRAQRSAEALAVARALLALLDTPTEPATSS